MTGGTNGTTTTNLSIRLNRWSQAAGTTTHPLQVNASNQAVCASALCSGGGYAFWGTAATAFGANQGAAVTFVNAPSNNTALYLKETGNVANGIGVRYSTTGGGTVIVETRTGGGAFVQAGNLPGAIVAGDTLTATVSSAGVVSVWVNSTSRGSVQLPSSALWTTGGGRIGLQGFAGSLFDNFSGGTLP